MDPSNLNNNYTSFNKNNTKTWNEFALIKIKKKDKSNNEKKIYKKFEKIKYYII